MKVGRREALTLGLLGVGAVALIGSSGSKPKSPRRSRRPYTRPSPKPGGGWKDKDAPERIRAIAQPLADMIGWPDLPDFLVAIAWTESRGNSQAQNGTSANSARGWFQLRPNSARVEDAGLTAAALKDERSSVALITWYLHRLAKYAKPGQQIDLLALRRGMAYPFLVADVEETMATPSAGPGVRSRESRERFATGIAAAGLPDSFMYHAAFPAGYAWPGIHAALAATGAGAVS